MFPEDGNVPRGVSRKQVGIITTQAVVRDGHMNRAPGSSRLAMALSVRGIVCKGCFDSCWKLISGY